MDEIYEKVNDDSFGKREAYYVGTYDYSVDGSPPTYWTVECSSMPGYESFIPNDFVLIKTKYLGNMNRTLEYSPVIEYDNTTGILSISQIGTWGTNLSYFGFKYFDCYVIPGLANSLSE